VAIYTGAKALSRWPINDESTLTLLRVKAELAGGLLKVLTLGSLKHRLS
jgi:hypothetical protein